MTVTIVAKRRIFVVMAAMEKTTCKKLYSLMTEGQMYRQGSLKIGFRSYSLNTEP